MPANPLDTDDPSNNPLLQGSPTWADAWSYNRAKVAAWLAQQQAISARRGLWNPQTELPTGAGLVNAAQQYGNALMMGTTTPGFTAFHGSPYDFERFDPSKIGTGEGAQAYGHGLYFAGNEGVARSYRDQLAFDPRDALNGYLATFPQNATQAEIKAGLANHPLQAMRDLADNPSAMRDLMTVHNGYDQASGTHSGAAMDAFQRLDKTLPPRDPGHMYEVNIVADPEHFLDWDKPLSEQSQHVQDALGSVLDAHPEVKKSVDFQSDFLGKPPSASAVYNSLANRNDPAYAAQALQQAGIPGIRYLDQGSRAEGKGTYNHVVFDANTINILRKYGIAGLGLGLGAAATQGGGSDGNGGQPYPTAQ